MKYVLILGDGMAGQPLEELGGKTTLEFARTPAMDRLASMGTLGMVQTVPDGMQPGSDVANLGVMGYDPAIYYSGRSPLEALSVGVPMADTDVVYRTNIVTLSEAEPYKEKTILDHSSGEISTEDADVLMDAIRSVFSTSDMHFYTGTSYRHILQWENGRVMDMEPPHDHLGQVIGAYLPADPAFAAMMERSFQILNEHPLNIKRAQEGKNKANSLWFWGGGTKPSLKSFYEKTGKHGAMISAVDLLKGLAIGAGMKVIAVEGATGSLETNYEGKAQAAVDALLKDNVDFVYVHLEGPDEMGHHGKTEDKVLSIEYLDSRIIAPIQTALENAGEDYRMLILPDHPTPICKRTHTADAVPYLLYDSTDPKNTGCVYNEKTAAATDNFCREGYRLIEQLLK